MDSGREALQAPHDSSRFQRKQHWLANACIWVPSATSPHPRVLHMYTQLESDALPSKAAAPLSPPQRSVSAKSQNVVVMPTDLKSTLKETAFQITGLPISDLGKSRRSQGRLQSSASLFSTVVRKSFVTNIRSHSSSTGETSRVE